MKDYDENKESSYLQYWDVNYLYAWSMSQKFKDTYQFNKDFIRKL